MWEVSNYTKTGERNRMEGLKCQDYVYYMERGDIQIITLADGTGKNPLRSQSHWHPVYSFRSPG